jgi:uncharacterized protein (TIGR03435 family)
LIYFKINFVRLNVGKTLALAVVGIVALALPTIVGILNVPVIRAQSVSAAAPKFEVASIKRCETNATSSGDRSGGLRTTPGRLSVSCLPVKFLIQAAYATSPDASVPISGGPPWIDSDLYDIEAKADNNPSREEMSGPMLQALLEERFKLRIHRGTKEVPVYDLTVGKSGPKLQAFKEGSCVSNDPEKPPATTPGQKRPIICGSYSIGLKGANLTLDVHKRSMTEFSRQLHLDRPVIDKTGITGLFDFHLEFASDGTTAGFFPPGFPALSSDAPDGPSIFTAIQEQLGLKLEPSKGPEDLLVIEGIEKPTKN